MFGHVERPVHWARHLLHIRDLQARTGGFTEFVPLPFVHMEAPIYLRGRARKGPTWREMVLMHAVARLVLHPLIPNIQASWVKLGAGRRCRAASSGGANDLGGTLMNESISRAAGTEHGQEFAPERDGSADPQPPAARRGSARRSIGRCRGAARRAASGAAPLPDPIQTPFAAPNGRRRQAERRTGGKTEHDWNAVFNLRRRRHRRGRQRPGVALGARRPSNHR